MAGGILSAIITGGAMPVYSVLLSDIMGILSEEVDDAREETIMYSFLFVGLGVIVGSAYFFQVNS